MASDVWGLVWTGPRFHWPYSERQCRSAVQGDHPPRPAIRPAAGDPTPLLVRGESCDRRNWLGLLVRGCCLCRADLGSTSPTPDPLHAIHGTLSRTPLLRAFAAGQGQSTTARWAPLLSLAVPCCMPQTCPKGRRWLMSHLSTIPNGAQPPIPMLSSSSEVMHVPQEGLARLPARVLAGRVVPTRHHRTARRRGNLDVTSCRRLGGDKPCSS
jgi:hypothetical protein